MQLIGDISIFGIEIAANKHMTARLWADVKVQFTVSIGLHSVLEWPFSEANGRPFSDKRSPLIVC